MRLRVSKGPRQVGRSGFSSGVERGEPLKIRQPLGKERYKTPASENQLPFICIPVLPNNRLECCWGDAGQWAEAGTVLELYSGMPFDVHTGADNNHDGVLADRPAGVSRNRGHGPGFEDLDVNVSHNFVLGKHFDQPENLRISLSSFNALNRPNDFPYVGIITSPFCGQAVAAFPPRRMQISAEFNF